MRAQNCDLVQSEAMWLLQVHKWGTALHWKVSPDCMLVVMVSSSINSYTSFLTRLVGSFDTHEFALRLWGDIYFDGEDRVFLRKPSDPEDKRTFVHFILEPLYKLYTQVRLDGTRLKTGPHHLRSGSKSRYRRPQRYPRCFGNRAEAYHVQDGCSSAFEGRSRSILWSIHWTCGYACSMGPVCGGGQ